MLHSRGPPTLPIFFGKRTIGLKAKMKIDIEKAQGMI
jgi:hypothetical protein